MLSRDRHVLRLSHTAPSQPPLAAHIAIPNSAVGVPLANDVTDELDLAPQVVCRRNSLKFWANLGPVPRWVTSTASANTGGRLARWRGKVQESL